MINWEIDNDGIVTLTMDDPNQGANTMNATFQESFAATVRAARGREGQHHRRHPHLREEDLLRRRRPRAAQPGHPGGCRAADQRAAGAPGAAARAGDPRPSGCRGDQRRRARRWPGDRAGLPPPHRAGRQGQRDRPARGHPRPAARRRRRRPHRADVRPAEGADGGAAAGPAAQAGRCGRGRARRRGRRHPRRDARGRANAWIKANPEAAQPWDAKGYKIPGGTPSNPKFAAGAAGLPGEPAQAAQGCPDARAAPHHGRGGRGLPGRLRHRRRGSRRGTSSTWPPARSART